MKENFKRKISLIMIVLIGILTFTGCNSREEKLSNKEDIVSQVSKGEYSFLNNEESALLSLLDEVENRVEVGTAGSSLKVVTPTLTLMDWAVNTKLNDKQIKKVVDIKLKGMSKEEKENFLEQMSLVNSTYKRLLSDTRDDLLEASGNQTAENYSWYNTIKSGEKTLTKLDSLMEVLGFGK